MRRQLLVTVGCVLIPMLQMGCSKQVSSPSSKHDGFFSSKSDSSPSRSDGSASAGSQAAKQQAEFQGNWSFVSMEEAGVKKTDHEMKSMNMSFFFKGDKVTWYRYEVFEQGVFRLDPSTNPKRIDMFTGNSDGPRFLRGVYEINGDNMKICVAYFHDEYPMEFVSHPKPNEQGLYVLKKTGSSDPGGSQTSIPADQINPEMKDFLTAMNVDSKSVSAGLKKHAAKDIKDPNGIGDWGLESPIVTKKEQRDDLVCYTVVTKAGIITRTFEICWQGDKIKSVKQTEFK
jgi:uncharacterized protein (TIGR03067 family)